MAIKPKQLSAVTEEAPVVERKISLEMENGSVTVSRDGLTFSISGRNVHLQKQSPLNLSFESGEVAYDDGEIRVKAQGDAVKLQLD